MNGIIEIIVTGTLYTANLVGCYDGDSCKIQFTDTPALIAEQSIRFGDFDTPEIRGVCDSEKAKARQARAITRGFMSDGARLMASGKKGKYGRYIVYNAELKDTLIKKGLARAYAGGKRKGWCDAP